MFIPLKNENINVHNELLSMKLYIDANLIVVKKSNDEALQVSRLHNSTHVRCIDVPRDAVQRSSGSSRSSAVFQQHDGVRVVENTSILRMFQNFGNTREGEERENSIG
jgi:hypothetical protein